MLPPVRRVVTGHDSRGQAVIVSDGRPPTVEELAAVPGTRLHEIWSTDKTPASIDDEGDPTLGDLVLAPPPNGTRIRVVDIPPDSVQDGLSETEVAAAFAQIGGAHASRGVSGPHSLMHRTESVDYAIVLSGEVWLVVEEGETRLGPGDIVVQRGTNHAWSNRTDETARMVFVLVDGGFSAELRRKE
jgi:mannose-6-phosphate isomerase-like protein (cupin superfamily)